MHRQYHDHLEESLIDRRDQSKKYVLKKCQDLSRDTGFCTLSRIAFCAYKALITQSFEHD
jgi:hypothetical protein